jgi:cobalt-zinc-cadmium resistance protein CzcA
VKKNLFEGFVLVTVVLFFIPRQPAGGIHNSFDIPLSVLISFVDMKIFGVSANRS